MYYFIYLVNLLFNNLLKIINANLSLHKQIRITLISYNTGIIVRIVQGSIV